MKDSWIESLEPDELRFLSQVADILETQLGEDMGTVSGDIREEIHRRKAIKDHPFASDPANTMVKKWVDGKIKKYKNSLKPL